MRACECSTAYTIATRMDVLYEWMNVYLILTKIIYRLKNRNEFNIHICSLKPKNFIVIFVMEHMDRILVIAVVNIADLNVFDFN